MHVTLPNRIGTTVGNKLWSRYQDQEWRCVTDRTRNQRVRLRCHDGSDRTYRITVVTSCKCKKYSRQHNESGTEPKTRPGGGRGKGRPEKTGVRQNPKTDT
ncbi:hypothetical protein SKAU_G00429140 [Synaphobranchus kaupii]|uniref:Sclerostin domain-containing protein 1 n=1 Tax=Synaphobranchus kaupii TaxID=118154 RepID=A0A9Q1E4H8_SYNKA|nr:hypothetical protein SKAU_G00429140 [Synaphobranchus kaupii]